MIALGRRHQLKGKKQAAIVQLCGSECLPSAAPSDRHPQRGELKRLLLAYCLVMPQTFGAG